MLLFAFGHGREAALFALLAALLWVMHRGNIKRMMADTGGR